MDENNNHAEYRPAPGFNPYDYANAVKGIAESLHWLLTEGPGVDMHWSQDLRSTIDGLVWAQQKLLHELYDWLVNIENLTVIQLPITAEDFEEHHLRNQRRDDEVRDTPALYAIN